MTEYAEQGERAILLANRDDATPYAEEGERAMLLANRDDPLVPAPLQKYELRTAVEGFRDPTVRIRSSRAVWGVLQEATLASDKNIVVIPVDAKNHPLNIVGLRTEWKRQPAGPAAPKPEMFQNIIAAALLSGGVSFLLGVRSEAPMLEDGDPYIRVGSMGRRTGCTLLDIVIFSVREQRYVSMLDAGKLLG